MAKDTKQTDQFIKEMDLPAVTGTVEFKDGKHYFVNGKTKKEISSSLISEDKLKSMVGHPITALMAKEHILILLPHDEPINQWHLKCFMCYIIGPDMRPQVDFEIQQVLVNYFQSKNILNKTQADTLNKTINANKVGR
jgi:hypothetical protein